MAIKGYLAMTAAEIAAAGAPAYGLAYMACHFSPYGTGLVNLPRELPEGAMLILNDRIPPRGHDPRQITEQLLEVIRHCGCECVLLDFQQPGCKELECLAQSLSRSLPCPTAVSEAYAAGLSCPAFLPPVPPDVPLQTHLASWGSREIWLEISLEGLQIRLTEQVRFVHRFPTRRKICRIRTRNSTAATVSPQNRMPQFSPFSAPGRITLPSCGKRKPWV